MKVINEIAVLEIDGHDTYPDSRLRHIVVENHSIRSSDLVVLRVGGETVTVSARELRAGIDNATNAPR